MPNSLQRLTIIILVLIFTNLDAASALPGPVIPKRTSSKILFTPLRLEAENGQYQNMTQLAEANASNKKYLHGLTPGMVQWKFLLAAGGWYMLNFRYQASDGESVCQLGRNQASSDIGFGWTNQWYITGMVFPLQAGENTIELSCGSNSLDLDYVEIDTANVKPEMTPLSNIFYLTQPRDIIAKMNAYGRSLISITCGSLAISFSLEPYPYQEDAWKIRLNGADLTKLSPGDHILGFNLDSGESLQMNLTIMDSRSPALLTIIVPHVFHGNSVLFIFPTGKSMLLDCGEAEWRDKIVIPLLKKNDIEHLDYFYLSHYHSDHDGGDRGAKIMADFNVNVYEDNRTLTAGQKLLIEGSRIQIYNAYSGGSDENSQSLSFQLKYRDFVYVHGGDTYGSNQSAIMTAYANDLRAHVFFANHHFHGSANVDYLRSVDPFIVLLQADQAIYARSTYMDVFRKQTAEWLKAQHKRFVEAVPALEVGTTVIRIDDSENWTYETYGDTLVPLIPFLLSNNHRYEDKSRAPVFIKHPDSLLTSYTGAADIEYLTDKTAWLRFDQSDMPYQQMANEFTAGQGQILHQTTISGQHGEKKTLFIRARDRFGNESPALRCVVAFDTTAKPIPWHHPDYPDDSWKTGQAPIGFGNSDDKTTIEPVRTLYMRKSFTIADTIKALGVLLKGHDGLIAYINGVEVARLNMQEGPVSYSSRALQEPAKAFAKVVVLNQTGLQAVRRGKNVLAVEVHEAEAANPTISADIRVFNNIAIYSDLNQVWHYLDSGTDPPVWTSKDIASSISKNPHNAFEFELGCNYPNPFNMATTISFTLQREAHVNLDVYNRLGQHVAGLIDKEMPAGLHKTDWQAEHFPSGIYFIQLRTDRLRKIQKITLVK